MIKPYYEEPGITIYHGDCREILPQLEPVDLVLTDPPYEFESKGGGFYGDWHGKGHEARKYIGKLDDISCCQFNPVDFLPLLKCNYGYFFCNKSLIAKYISYAESNGFLYDVHVMFKSNPIPAKNSHFLHDIEYVIMMRQQGSFFNSDSAFKNYSKVFTTTCKPNNRHPAEKPIEIMMKYIEVSCPKDGVVIDPFAGSGTTLEAAKRLGVKAIGIDNQKWCCEIAVERLRQEVLSL